MIFKLIFALAGRVWAQEKEVPAEDLAPQLDLSNTDLPALTWQGLLETATAWAAVLVGLAALLGIIYSGYLMVTSSGDPAQMAKAKTNMAWSVGGFVLAVFAYVIVVFVFGVIKGLQ